MDVWRCDTPSSVTQTNASHAGADASQGYSSAEGY